MAFPRLFCKPRFAIVHFERSVNC